MKFDENLEINNKLNFISLSRRNSVLQDPRGDEGVASVQEARPWQCNADSE